MRNTFGKYKLERRLGLGAHCEIWKAHHGLYSDEPVAVKFLQERSIDDPMAVLDFHHEIKIMTGLHYPGIAELHHSGEIEGGPFFELDFVGGLSTSELMERAKHMEREIRVAMGIRLALGVLRSLVYLHTYKDFSRAGEGICHLDLSPDNVMCDPLGRVVLIDFGNASFNGIDGMTRQVEFRGTVQYMSPEQCLQKPLDARSDLFSLGSLLYEWTTGQMAFDREFDHLLIEDIVSAEFLSPSEIVPNYPKALEKIVLKAMEAAPENRFRDAKDFFFELQTISDDIGIPVGLLKRIMQEVREEDEKGLQETLEN